MSKSFHVSLKAGERLFVNGAVLRVDRKVSVEFLNDVVFLLEHHVMQPSETTTPLRQLYFVIQTMIIDPSQLATARGLYDGMMSRMRNTLESAPIAEALDDVHALVGAERLYEALKKIRALFPIEAGLIAIGRNPPAAREAVTCR